MILAKPISFIFIRLKFCAVSCHVSIQFLRVRFSRHQANGV